MPDWKREPLVHFLVIGALLFALGAFLGGGPESSQDRVVVVTEQDVERLRVAWQRQWRRPPTQEELRGLIDNYIREEILFREAIEMGLDENDTMIRRRLVQKIEFLTEDPVVQIEPSEEEMRQHFDANPDEYRQPARLTFTHIFFSLDSRGEGAWAEAEAVLGDLRAMSDPPLRAPELGDRFMMQYDYPRRSEADVARHMGREFAEAMFQLTEEGWQGPLLSGYGVHLVRVTETSESSLPEFGALRERIRDDLVRSRRETAKQNFYESLRSRYDIVVEGL